MNETADDPVEEILARCLTEPPFLRSIMTDRDVILKAYPLDARTRAGFKKIDLQRIRQFSGFIGKIQHNYLWDFVPATRRLLRHYNIELEVFSEYRSIQLSRELQSQPRSEKIQRFLNFLLDFITRKPEYSMLASVIRYERTACELGNLTDTFLTAPELAAEDLVDLPWCDLLRLIPKLSRPLRIEAYDCNPVALVMSVLDGNFAGYSAGETRLFAIRSDPANMVLQTFEIDELPALLLSCVDGRRSIRTVIAAARQRALATTPPRAFRAFFEDALTAGLIQIGSGGKACD